MWLIFLLVPAINAEISVSSVVKTGDIVSGSVFLLTVSNAASVRSHLRAEESQSWTRFCSMEIT